MQKFDRIRSHGGGYELQQDESERIGILKIWMTVMVVFIHANQSEFHYAGGDIAMEVPFWLDWIKYIISQAISGCAVPGFFFLSGILLYRREFVWKENLVKKIRTILVPYLIINTFWIAFYYAVQHISFVSGYFVQRQNIVATWTWKDWLGAYTGLGRTPVNSPIVGPTWFLRDLFILNILASLIRWTIDRTPGFTFLALLAVAPMAGGIIPLLKSYALVSFCMGCYAVKYSAHFRDIDKFPWMLTAGAYTLTIALCCLSRGTWIEAGAQGLCIVAGLIFFIRCTGILGSKTKEFFLRVARYSMPIYLFHMPCLSIVQKLAGRLLPQTPPVQAAEYFGLAAGIIILCVLGSIFFQRIAPRTYAVVTGGRTLKS